MTRASSIPLIAITLALLPAIAFSSPPDPSWIVGIYDGADADDIVTLITETPVASDATLFHVSPPLCSSEILHVSEPAHGHGSPSVQLIRGPPPNPSISLPRVARLRSASTFSSFHLLPYPSTGRTRLILPDPSRCTNTDRRWCRAPLSTPNRPRTSGDVSAHTWPSGIDGRLPHHHHKPRLVGYEPGGSQ
jgi:hypothetical protein